jgi:hypothetical protein
MSDKKQMKRFVLWLGIINLVFSMYVFYCNKVNEIQAHALDVRLEQAESILSVIARRGVHMEFNKVIE